MTPAEVFHPGEYLADEMAERGWTVEYLADVTGIDTDVWQETLDKRAGIRGTQAEALERIGWGSAVMWLHLSRAYRKWSTGR